MTIAADTVIRRGTVVTPGATSVADLAIHHGVVVQIGGQIDADEEIDAEGKFVLPGGVDMHVHLSSPSDTKRLWADDFITGSSAAAVGGITTVGDMTVPSQGESLIAATRRVRDQASGALVDFTLHPVLLDPSPERLAEIPELARMGYTSIKLFMIDSDFDRRGAEYIDAMHLAGRCGMLTLVHCEDESAIRYLIGELARAGRSQVSEFALSRPPVSERVAVVRAIAYAKIANSPIYIVHLSTAEALEETRRARATGQRVYVETRPIYLRFTDEAYAEPTGLLYVSFPPLRERSDVEALWAGISTGDIHTCCSDHSPRTLEDKMGQRSPIERPRPGLPNLETMMPMLFSDGVTAGRLTIERFVEVTSTNPAKLFGMYPRKGTIAVGSDADIAIWDPVKSRTIDAGQAVSRAGYDVYADQRFTGWPIRTISRGETISLDGKVVGRHGRGLQVQRGNTRTI